MTPEELRARREANIPDPEGIQIGDDGLPDGNPLDMIKALEGKGISTEDGTLMNLLSQQEIDALLKMIKHGEFNQKEAAFLKYLIATSGRTVYANLDDIGAMIGAASKKHNGQPVSKQAAFGELQRILTTVFTTKGPRYGIRLKPGKTGADVINFMSLNKKVQTAVKKVKKANEVSAKKAQRNAMKEFWELFKGNNKLRADKGIPRQSLGDLQNVINTFPNQDGSTGLKSQGDKVRLPVVSTNYHAGSDAIDARNTAARSEDNMD